MLEAKLQQGEILKKILDAIKELVNDANFDCNSNGMALQAMDTAHVSLVHLMLKKDAFERYRCDKNVVLGISMQAMNKMLKCAGKDDAISLKASDEPNNLALTFESKNGERMSEFEMKLIEIDAEPVGIPEPDYTAEITMPAAEFKKICSDLQTIGDTVTVSVNKDGVKFSVTGESGSGSITVRENTKADKSDESTSIQLKESVSLTFALKYLNTFCKSASLSNQVGLYLSKESPLLVEFKFIEDCYIRYYLAPKIDEEEEAADEE
ncbi:PCNA proliferating cell nuclear antigen [Naegleria gruberi]|uniref:DNA sliding clamp PCNA n=1 Tax=Naegleria gruberi TaxID=5762 RepID=D2V2D6_NAEGR|nr:PCNA proliferating cell nuclear antigen [Naegleria gruberi]EFC49039.1 PCNA proliferating cell nuclear antigen [Naegleria gruberi]|eukprot:XP_002681783.1 PCNA proliferating cell nuclear antigen [Naegleria gruberi strain NEG-M]